MCYKKYSWLCTGCTQKKYTRKVIREKEEKNKKNKKIKKKKVIYLAGSSDGIQLRKQCSHRIVLVPL